MTGEYILSKEPYYNLNIEEEYVRFCFPELLEDKTNNRKDKAMIFGFEQAQREYESHLFSPCDKGGALYDEGESFREACEESEVDAWLDDMKISGK